MKYQISHVLQIPVKCLMLDVLQTNIRFSRSERYQNEAQGSGKPPSSVSVVLNCFCLSASTIEWEASSDQVECFSHVFSELKQAYLSSEMEHLRNVLCGSVLQL